MGHARALTPLPQPVKAVAILYVWAQAFALDELDVFLSLLCCEGLAQAEGGVQ